MATRRKKINEMSDDEILSLLRLHCRDSGNCLAFTQYDRIIKTFFDQFINFDNVVLQDIKSIGTSSGNGFILELPFVKQNVRAFCALKCAINALGDNLYYEHYVGKKFINHFTPIFPCFLETYGLLKIKNEKLFKKYTFPGRSGALPDLSDIFDIVEFDNVPELSCQQNENYCVMVQHFNRYVSLNELANATVAIDYDVRHDRFDIPTICYQVYFVLDVLKDMYTHYDLHGNNVLLYKPYVGKKYVLMRYHTLSGKIIQFKTEYIAKIIDYGRNFFDTTSFDGTSFTNSDDFVRSICDGDSCQPECGINHGYKRIRGIYGEEDEDFIYPNQSNVSHDLRLLTDRLADYLIDEKFFKELHYDSVYGTEEITVEDVSEGGQPMHVYNVHDARVYLEQSLMNWTSRNNKYDGSWIHAATIDIYEDQRPYHFKSLIENGSRQPVAPKTVKRGLSRKLSSPFFSPGL